MRLEGQFLLSWCVAADGVINSSFWFLEQPSLLLLVDGHSRHTPLGCGPALGSGVGLQAGLEVSACL